jgi:hypothetical protein
VKGSRKQIPLKMTFSDRQQKNSTSRNHVIVAESKGQIALQNNFSDRNRINIKQQKSIYYSNQKPFIRTYITMKTISIS